MTFKATSCTSCRTARFCNRKPRYRSNEVCWNDSTYMVAGLERNDNLWKI
jgi:hypothetical protein